MARLSSRPVAAVAAPVVGIDVAKERLDVAVLRPDRWPPAGRVQPQTTFACATTLAALGRLALQLAALAPTLVVLEASGGYEQPVVRALWAADLPVAVVNPRRVRAFAHSAGYLAKTDRLDAGVLAHFGLVLCPPPQPPPAPQLAAVGRLVRRREQLVALLATERQRAHQWARRDAAIHASCQALIAVLVAEVAVLAAAIDAAIASDPALAQRIAQLESVPGIGRIVAATLVATLPELGLATGGEVAALAGLAPLSRESGQWRGARHIGGGRTAPRRILYLAAVNARRCNPVIRAVYERLRAAGKPAKVALVACARKLVVLINALVRDGTTWADRMAAS